MRNYGEVLAYWYLRLNGFFILQNFVFHRGDTGESTADCDLLAVRFPHVYEEVGGQESDWDHDLLTELGASSNRVICLIVEVKTGRYSIADLDRAFSLERLTVAVQRVGAFPRVQAEEIAQELVKAGVVPRDPYCFAKLAIVGGASRPDSERYVVRRLDQAVGFIRKRMKEYKDVKEADRMFFPDPLMQYFAAEAGLDG